MDNAIEQKPLVMSDNAQKIVAERYFCNDEKGWGDVCQRVARFIATADVLHTKDVEKIKETERSLYNDLFQRWFIFNSPTLFNAGLGVCPQLLYKPIDEMTLVDYQKIYSQRNGKNMLAACFYLTVDNSIQDIYTTLQNAAILTKHGGGVGFNFSYLSQEGRPLDSGIGVASGPLPFIRLFNESGKAVSQGGRRRGAFLATLDITHPDIEKFIHVKDTDGELSYFNISVLVTDEFMKAVKESRPWSLIDPVTKVEVRRLGSAKNLWQQIIHSAWLRGDPGLLFFNAMNRDAFIADQDIIGTNPCLVGETLVAVADGREAVSIKQLAEEGKDIPVYTVDDYGKLTIRIMRNPRCTGKGVPVYRVTLDSGDYLEVTENHKFYLKDGETKEAKNLKYGDRLEVMSKYIEPNETKDYLICNYRSQHCKEHKLIQQFHSEKAVKERDINYKSSFISEYENSGLGSVVDLSLGDLQSTYEKAIEQGYEVIIKQTPHGKQVFVKKYCEYCALPFWVEYYRREVSFDSTACSTKQSIRRREIREAIKRKKKLLNYSKQELIREQQAQVYSDLKFDWGRDPLKKEWIAECKRRGISVDINKSDSPFRNMSALTEAAELVNCKVVSVEFIGYKDVYNGTVDDFHNFFTGGFAGKTTKRGLTTRKFIRQIQCGEQPLYDKSSCNLGHINLRAFAEDIQVGKLDKFVELIHRSIHYLDNVIDMSWYPIQEIAKEVRDYRPIGLGIMGFAHLLFKLGVRYGSKQSLDVIDTIGSCLMNESIIGSVMLAKERGAYPQFFNDRKWFEKSTTAKFLSYYEVVRELRCYYDFSWFDKCGVRNATLNTIAPTGTVSLIADTSSGLEPVFALTHERKFIDVQGKEQTLLVADPLYKEAMDAGVSLDCFVDANMVSVEERIAVQSAWQKYIDTGISSTVNLPHDATEEAISQAYMLAWEKGCKGITVFRDGCKGMQVLKRVNTEEKPKESIITVHPYPRPKRAYGVTTETKVACGGLYTTINKDEMGNLVETFLSTSKGGGCRANSEGLSRMISLALRSGVNPKDVIKQLKGIKCPVCQNRKDVEALSCPDAVAVALLEALKESDVKTTHEKVSGKLNCPSCGNELQFAEGCVTCPECGWSKCG